ncbi:MAG TPA: hypothetical protein ENK09_04210 [Nitrospirae bacterium]|nr:hypothetical protein [Nitrospirota bacterium]
MVKRISILFCFLLLLPVFAHAEDISGCIVCHNVMAGKIDFNGKVIDLNVDAKRFETSVHGAFACTECHERFHENPHVPPDSQVTPEVERLSEEVALKAKADPVALAACSKCHNEEYRDVIDSVHGKNIVEEGKSDGALCLDCHGSAHYITKSTDKDSPVNKWKVVDTCGRCHGKEELAKKYGIEANVMKSYFESFHGKKHILGHKRAPTCVNCHGYHAIKSKDDPTSPVFGTNKIKTCGKCHKGANKKFVAAITHKEPGPIPHYAEKGLIILTISVIAFTVLHVLLEAYSDLRDVLFRRRKEVEHEEGKEYSG